MKLLHTSDWQLGLKLRFMPGDRGAQARLERFETVRRIAALAHTRKVDLVLVAGDVFDDNTVGPDTLQRARDSLAAFAPLPVLLLPGNHDAAVPGGALARLAPHQHGLPHVHTLLGREPFEAGGAVVHPCPLLSRHTLEDPTRHLPAREGQAGMRVALAHGGVREFSESTATPNLVDPAAVLAKGFDYLALGDWHGSQRFGPRVAYSGTPEPTRFEEKNPGNVLVVDIEGPGAEPRVEEVAIARTRWLTHAASLHDEADLAGLEAWLAALPEKSWTLLELRLEGSLPLGLRARLDALLAGAEGALLHLRLADEALVTAPTDAELAALAGAGFVGRAVETLKAEAGEEARDALLLLARLVGEVAA